jgi:hypothetical protein
MPISKLLSCSAILATAAVTSACMTTVKMPASTVNPPPLEAFSAFNTFDLKPINTQDACSKQAGADSAFQGIQGRLDKILTPVLTEWNQRKKPETATRRLIIEPFCTDAKMIGTAKRIFTGPLSGSSAVVMRVRYTDAASGRVVAEPEFYQRAFAMGGAYSFGGTDRNMLTRMTTLITEYTQNNYRIAVGGPTGVGDEAPAEATTAQQ